jgi:tetratricopeptide (TPR) repeat protein
VRIPSLLCVFALLLSLRGMSAESPPNSQAKALDLAAVRTMRGAEIAPNPDWKDAVIKCVTKLKFIEDDEEKGGLGLWGNGAPFEALYVNAVAALKAHSENDAVRMWLLSIAAYGLQSVNSYTGSQPSKTQLQQAVTAAREAEGIINSPDAEKAFPELAELLVKHYTPACFPPGTPEKQLLNSFFSKGCYAAAYCSLRLHDSETARKYFREQAYRRLARGCDCGFPRYHEFLSGEGSVWTGVPDIATLKPDNATYLKAAKEDLAAAEKIGLGDTQMAQFHYRLSQALLRSNEQSEVASEMTRALALDPVGGGLSLSTVWCRRESKPLDESERRETVVAECASALSKSAQTDKAIELLLAERKKKPASVILLHQLALTYDSMNKKDLARTVCTEILDLYPCDLQAALWLRLLDGKAKEEKNPDGSIKILDPEGEKGRAEAKALGQKIGPLAKSKKWDEILALAQEARKSADPKSSLGFESRSQEIQALGMLGRLEEASDALGQLEAAYRGDDERRFCVKLRELLESKFGSRERQKQKAAQPAQPKPVTPPPPPEKTDF